LSPIEFRCLRLALFVSLISFRLTTFKDLRGTFTEEQLKKETERCLSCGAVVVDEDLCVGCGMCTTKCKFDAIKLVKKYDAENIEFSNLKPVIIRSVIKRNELLYKF
jgi:ferredoxin